MTVLLFVQIKAQLYIFLKLWIPSSLAVCAQGQKGQRELSHLFYVIGIWGFKYERMTAWSPNEENQSSKLTPAGIFSPPLTH